MGRMYVMRVLRWCILDRLGRSAVHCCRCAPKTVCQAAASLHGSKF